MATSESQRLADERRRLLDWLAKGVEDIAWALRQLPPERLTARPPHHVSDWPALQHVWHLATYERTVALPSLDYLVSGEIAALRRASAEAPRAQYSAGEELQPLLLDLAEVKERERRLLESVTPEDWANSRLHPFYGTAVTPLWMLQKSYQHTLEHLTAIWQMALFWDL